VFAKGHTYVGLTPTKTDAANQANQTRSNGLALDGHDVFLL
jgi:hypothetical protein